MRRAQHLQKSDLRLAKYGGGLAVLIYLIWIALVAALVMLSMRSDPEGALPAGIETILTGLGIALAFMSVTAWVIAIRLLPTDADLSSRGRQVWWVLLIVANLFSGPAYLLSLLIRQCRSG